MNEIVGRSIIRKDAPEMEFCVPEYDPTCQPVSIYMMLPKAGNRILSPRYRHPIPHRVRNDLPLGQDQNWPETSIQPHNSDRMASSGSKILAPRKAVERVDLLVSPFCPNYMLNISFESILKMSYSNFNIIILFFL